MRQERHHFKNWILNMRKIRNLKNKQTLEYQDYSKPQKVQMLFGTSLAMLWTRLNAVERNQHHERD